MITEKLAKPGVKYFQITGRAKRVVEELIA